MDVVNAAEALLLPVRLQGLKLGRPTDLLVGTEGTWRALGFVVRCRDEAERFLPYAASHPGETEITVGSALMLLDDVDFYRRRAASFSDLLGSGVERRGHAVGTLRDLVLGAGGHVTELVLEDDGGPVRVAAAGCRIASPHVSAA